jgi:hypothetical protein
MSDGTPTGNPNRAVHRHNGLSMRCTVGRDLNTTDTTNAIRQRRYLYYELAES